MSGSAWRITALMAIVALAPVAAAGAGSAGIAGRIVDRTGDPVPGALVTITCGDVVEAVRTDENGAFQSPRLPAGPCTVVATLPGLEARAEGACTTAEGGLARVDLALDLDMLQEYVLCEAPPARDSVDFREIREGFSRDAGEAAARIDGLHAIRKGGIAADVVLRGFKGENLSVLVDGHRIYGACPNRMDPPAFHVDFAEVERIEVDKGPFDLSNAGSLGGTVNIVTREPDAGPHAHLNLTAGSFGYAAPSLGGSWANERWSVHGGVAGRQGDPFEDGSGAPFTDDPDAKYRAGAGDEHAFDIRTFWAGTTVAVRPGHRLEFQATRQEGNRQLYPYLQMDAEYDDANRALVRYLAQGPFGGSGSLEASVSWAAVDHVMTDALRLTSVDMTRPYSMATDADSSVAHEKVEMTFGRGWAFGLEAYQRNWNTVTALAGSQYVPQASIPDVDVSAAGAYAKLDRALDVRWKVQAALRVDSARSAADPTRAATALYDAYHGTRETSRTDTDPSASLAVTFAATPTTEVFIGVGSAVRFPDPQELYFALKRKDSNWVGHPALEPARNNEFDAGLRVKSHATSFDLTLYASSIEDAIAVVDAAPVAPGPGSKNARSYVNNDARMLGGEASAHWTAGRSFVVSAGVSFVRGEQDVDPSHGITDPDLPEIAPLEARASVRYDTGRWFLEAAGTAATRQDRVNDDLLESETAGWGVLDLRGGVTLGRFSLVAGADNVFDRLYRKHFSYLRDPFRSGAHVNEPGRTYSMSLLLRY